MKDVLRWQVPGGCRDGRSGQTAAGLGSDCVELLHDHGASRIRVRAIDPSSAPNPGVRGIRNGIDRHLGDIAFHSNCIDLPPETP